MNTRTLSASTLAVLAFATVALSQTQPTTNNTDTTTTATESSLNVTPGNGPVGHGDTETVKSDSANKFSFLKPFVGTWKGSATLHGVEGADSSSSITCTSTLTFGHYLTTNFDGKLMNEPFQAVQTWGFNTDTNAFETTWIDNNSTGITFNNGSANADGSVLTIDGQVEGADGATITQRSVTTLVDNNHFTLELVSVDSQNVSTPVMTISFTRQSNTAAAPATPFPVATTSNNTQWDGTTNQTNSTAPTVASNVAGNAQANASNNAQPVQFVHRFFASRQVNVEVTSNQVDTQRAATVSEPRN